MVNNFDDPIKPSYRFKEVTELQKLPLDDKIQIAVRVLKQAFSLCSHTPAIAFSGGKDSEVVADLIERFCSEEFERTHCIFGNTGIEFPESLRFAREYGREHFGERDALYKLFRLKHNANIFDSLADENILARMIERFGNLSTLLDTRPCAFDEFGELVDLTGTGLESEYDAEIMLDDKTGQLKWI